LLTADFISWFQLQDTIIPGSLFLVKMLKVTCACLFVISLVFVVTASSFCVQWTHDYTIYPFSRHTRSEEIRPKTNSLFKERNERSLDPFASGKSQDIRITCSNVSSDTPLDYHYEERPYKQDLFIVNSTIQKLSAHSFLSNFTHLRTLYLVSLGIEEVSPGAFNGLVVLDELDLAANKLVKISNGVFNNLETLLSLDVSRNLISEIEENSFLGLVSLTDLYLNNNNITFLHKNLFKDFRKLESLWISHNPLKEFPSDINLPSLKTFLDIGTNLKTFDLDLSGSFIDMIKITQGQFETVDFAKFPNLTRTLLDWNKISSVKNWNKLNCYFVFMRGNKITEVEIPDNVVYLYLMENSINSVKSKSSGQVKKLQFLNLSFNKINNISSESFWGLTELQVLVLEHNNITVLHENSFVNCTNLSQLNLAHNQIEVIEPNTFNGAVRLGQINLWNNKLKVLKPPSLMDLKSGNIVIGNNKISWDDLKSVLNSNEKLQIEIDPLIWKCEKLNSNDSVLTNNIRYLKKHLVNKILCTHDDN
jgi:Leucine-rich repeat (LRR) protein